ncbi:MAG TPA: AarF/UbiB family protein [Acidimicrobiales bacterium]|nr:AarF/UbiB family protein [Acidimicrobiales bacterium]
MSESQAAMAAGPAASTVEQGVDLRKLSPVDARRLVEVGVTLARHGALVVARRGPYLVFGVRQRAPRAIAVALRRSFADLGPTYVKFGQLVASSPGLFPAVLCDEFRHLLDHVPAEPAKGVRRTIREDFGRAVRDVFASFDDVPVAAASIAQVHLATLHDGRRVAVKVRRPNLRRKMERDLRLMRLLAKVLEQAGTLGELANPGAIIDDFATTLRAELDFRNEARWMTEFEANLRDFGDNDRVVVPKPVTGMVTRRVLVMNFIDGRPVDDVASLAADGHDLEELLLAAIRAWAEGALVHGLFHGDVHAGNLMVTDAGRIAFLDFGIMGEITGETRALLLNTLPVVLFGGDFTRAAEVIVALGAATRPVDLAGLARDIEVVAQPLLGATLADVNYGELLSQVLTVAARHRLRLPREMVLLAKQLLYFERYAKAMAPDYRLLSDPRIIEHLLQAQTASADL